MHVWAGDLQVAQGRNGELAAVAFFFGDRISTEILEGQIEPIVGKIFIPKQQTAVTMKTARARFLEGGIVIRVEQLRAALFLGGELGFSSVGAIELRIERETGQKKLLQGFGKLLGGNLA